MSRLKPGDYVSVETDDIPFTARIVCLDGNSGDACLQSYFIEVDGRTMEEPILGMFLRGSTLDAIASADEIPLMKAGQDMTNTITKAARFARVAHGGQKRDLTGDPYIRHPARVASRVTMLDKSLGDDVTATEQMIVAAWLHDVVEDTPTSIEQVQKEFGLIVASFVTWLTNEFTSKRHPKTKRVQRKELELTRLREAPEEVRAIKLLDRIDNLREIDHTGSFAVVYVQESDDLAEALGHGLLVLKAELQTEITKLRERMERR